MAPIAKSLAIAATAFAALGAAAPGHGHKHNHKRDEVTVWKTMTTVVWTTVDITTTIHAGQQAPASTYIEETVNHASAPQPEPEAETTSSTTTATETTTSTSTSTSTVETTSTVEPEAPSVQTPDVQVVQPTISSVSVATELPTVSVPSVDTEPEETSTAEPEPTSTSTTQAAAPTSDSGSGSTGSTGYSGPCSASSPCTGQITFYDVATSMSAPSSCGMTNDGSVDNVIALPVGIMQDSDCGRSVTVKYGGKTSKGTVVDKCMGCDDTSIDLSRHFFSELASFAEGRISGVEWYLD